MAAGRWLMAVVLVQGCFILPRQAPTPVPKKTPAQKAAEAVDSANKAQGLKTYAKVIPPGARSTEGLFLTHRVGDTLYFEIPRKELNKDMLLVGRFAQASGGNTFGGDEFTQRVLRWEKQGNRILLRSVSFEIAADSTLPISRAVRQASYPPIVAVFQIESYGADSAAVIDVTRLYTTNIPEFVGARGSLDEKRSYIERAQAFPDNVEVEATQTSTPDNPPESQRISGPIPAASVLAHWSMVRLPERRMTPRLADKRVGFLSIRQTDYGTSQQRAVERSYIARWRLEKKFPDSLLSDPVKPIVYYIDPATPAQWIPWIKKGIEDWQPAFAAAGFRRAIIARDAPTSAEDSTWSPDDVRHTVIRWLPSTTENAFGPTIVDPRTGEIMNGSVKMFHNVMNLVRDWYFVQVSPLDRRAQRLPFPDSLMGRLLEFIVAHEVGHTLGLLHNMKASSTYPADSVRSATWVHRMGHTPSIMDYSRLNYVAQPEDRIDVADLVPRVGPYDVFAIMWGYKPLPGFPTPDAERPALNAIAEMQDSVPWFRYSTSGDNEVDPGDQSEAVGDADAVKSTRYGLKNIERVVPLLMSATLRPGEDNSQLLEMYDRVIDQWAREMEHVANVVGGAESREKYGGQLGPRFVPLPRARQKAAVRFLNENAFTTPSYLVNADVLRRIEANGTLVRIGGAQSRILSALLENDRLARLSDYEALSKGRSADVYAVPELLADIRQGIWKELNMSSVAIDPFRRALQRSWLTQADAKINPPPAIVISSGRTGPSRIRSGFGPNSDVRALMRGELNDLDAMLRSTVDRAANRETRLHLLDARAEIKRILDPNQ
ncbi:MAG TPA: zinc-dependent metalloprotease [Gemmatimonadaceae bacterium]|nr:zinc-dependent metalloprotease [Gemmatimonadaceae bacterium]